VGLSQFNLPNFTSTVSVVNVAIASISGFLFAVTYRYIVRDDQNPHLKSGAVSAFGLVRGLAQIQEPLDSIVNIMAIAESLILFNVIRYGLEFLWQRIHRLT
jgi:ammonia channel protein AmtB